MILSSQFLKCCFGCEDPPMGSMCARAKQTTDPDYLEHPSREHDKKEEEVQPLVSDDNIAINQNKDENQQLIPPFNQDKKQRSRSPTPPSDDYEEDKQLLQDAMADIEQLNSDDNNSNNTPEYSKDNNENEDDMNDSTPISKIDNFVKMDEKKQEEKHDIIDEKYALPKTLKGIPIESMEEMDEEDKKCERILREKYKDQLNKYSCIEKMNFIHRYVIGYKHIKKKKKMAMIFSDIDFFFQMYEKYDFDNIINSNSTNDELNAWKQFLYGEDEYGHPVMYDLIGSGDCKQMKRVFMKDDKSFGEAAYWHVFRFMRKLENYKRQNSLKYGKQIHKQIQIMDMKGFTSDHLKGKNRKMTKMIITTLTRMYPEGVYKMYIINAPWPFRALWTTVKGFLDPITVQKTKVLGNDYLKQMIKDIPIHMIPKEYGGKGIWDIQYGNIPKKYGNIDIYHGLD